MARMNLEEKIRQMTQIERADATTEVMKNYYIGSVLNGGGCVPAPKESLATWINIVEELQKGAMSTRLQIHVIHGIDVVHGHNNVYGYTIFPHNIGLGATRDPDLARIRIGVATAFFAEILDGGADMRATVRIQKLPRSNVAACAKHFVGMAVQPRGFVISDWQGLDIITIPPDANYSLSVFDGVSAGIDMVMVPTITDFINDLIAQVMGGFISMTRINDAVQRILRVKFTMGLFEYPMANPSLANQLGSKEHRELAREVVRKYLVLLKNGKFASKPLLPLDKNAPKILVAGTHPDNMAYQCGGWTMEWQGLSGNSTVGTTILEAIRFAVNPSTEFVYQQNPDANYVKVQGFSYAIVVVGETPYAETNGDNLNLIIPLGRGNTIKKVCGSLKCLVILISGRPLVIEPYLPLVDAFVTA